MARRYLAKSTSHSGFLVLSTLQNRQQAKPRGPPTANFSLVAPTPQPIPLCSHSNRRRPPRPNLHSLNAWPAVQCNEGFCNASEGQRLPLTTTMASQKPHHSANSIRRAGRSSASTPESPRVSIPLQQSGECGHLRNGDYGMLGRLQKATWLALFACLVGGFGFVVWSASQKPPPHYRSSPTKTEQKENQPPKTVINSGTQKDRDKRAQDTEGYGPFLKDPTDWLVVIFDRLLAYVTWH